MRLDSLGDRMKAYESNYSDSKLLPNLPIIVRLDGRGFSKFTKNMCRPYDRRMSELMVETTKYLCKEYNAVIGYTQSDEISLILLNIYPESTIFNGKIQKVVSSLAASASAFFNVHFPVHFQTGILEYSNVIPTFDCRIFNVPSFDEATNCILWRYLDCQKNAISMAAHHHFSHSSLQNQNSSKMKDRLLVEANIRFDLYPNFFTQGTFIKKVTYPKLNQDGTYTIRSKHEADNSLSKPFSQLTHEERMSYIF